LLKVVIQQYIILSEYAKTCQRIVTRQLNEVRLQISIRTIELSESHLLSQLRQHAYDTKFGPRVDKSALVWNTNDLLFMNLGAFDSSGQLVSALRLATIESAEEFKRVLLLEFDPSRLKLPLMILSRGATLPEFQSRHLHSLLRREAIFLAQQSGMKHVVGGIENATPRLSQLAGLGYEIIETQTKWDGFLKSESNISMAVLDDGCFSKAIGSLETKIKSLSVTRQFQLEDLVLRIKLHAHRVSHETLPFGVDNIGLWREVEDFLHTHPPAVRSPAVSGWALQAPIGSINPIHAGWEVDFCPYNGPGNLGPTWTPRDAEERALISIQNFDEPTEAMFPKMGKLIADFQSRGLVIRRARIIRLAPGANMKWHQDGSKFLYQARIHIPLKTNENCFFESEFGRAHFAPDGSLYFVHINRPHRATNEGSTDRFHMVAHVWDTKAFTKHHQYDWRFFDKETHHRNEVDLPSQWSYQR
jgi:hypothetical protein